MNREQRIDEAVREFQRLNAMRWPCACIGCVITIRGIFRQLTLRRELAGRAPFEFDRMFAEALLEIGRQ